MEEDKEVHKFYIGGEEITIISSTPPFDKKGGEGPSVTFCVETTLESLTEKYLKYLSNSTIKDDYILFLTNLKAKGTSYVNGTGPTGRTGDLIPLNLKLLSRIDPNIRMNLVELKPSKIDRMGVFARRPIKEGDLITLFPVNFYYFTGDGEEKSGRVSTYDISNNFNHSAYSIHLNKNIACVGDPNKKNCGAYLGHFINDGFKMKNDNVKKYLRISLDRRNCRIDVDIDVPIFIKVIATKDINVGEEVFLSYGVEYWRDNK